MGGRVMVGVKNNIKVDNAKLGEDGRGDKH